MKPQRRLLLRLLFLLRLLLLLPLVFLRPAARLASNASSRLVISTSRHLGYAGSSRIPVSLTDPNLFPPPPAGFMVAVTGTPSTRTWPSLMHFSATSAAVVVANRTQGGSASGFIRLPVWQTSTRPNLSISFLSHKRVVTVPEVMLIVRLSIRPPFPLELPFESPLYIICLPGGSIGLALGASGSRPRLLDLRRSRLRERPLSRLRDPFRSLSPLESPNGLFQSCFQDSGCHGCQAGCSNLRVSRKSSFLPLSLS